jgi:hypothetical protein
MQNKTADQLKVGDPVYVDSIDNWGATGVVLEIRDTPGLRCKVLLDDLSQPPFWCHDQELQGPHPDPPPSGYDSRPDTWNHLQEVRQNLRVVIDDLVRRGLDHDRSKFFPPEKEIFDEYTPKLRETTYDSPEYRSFLAAMKPALDHHYDACDHHPEHFRWHCPCCNRSFPESETVRKIWDDQSHHRFCRACVIGDSVIWETELSERSDQGLQGMNLIQITEMICDWLAATKRHADGDPHRSIELNQSRFGYSDELKQILHNTVTYLEYLSDEPAQS